MSLHVRSSDSIPPFQFVQVLRQLYPQFAQQNQRGGYMQQDAEELYGAVTTALAQVPIRRQGGRLTPHHPSGEGDGGRDLPS